MSETIAEDTIAEWQGWIGRTETRSEVLDVQILRRFAAAIGETLDVERVLPSLAHWAFFLPVVGDDEMGPDGHPRRGGFLPPITLPRRMFAASDMRFEAPLLLGEEATLTSTVADVRHRSGRTGALVFVEVDRVIEQGGVRRIEERQTIVYRATGERVAWIADAGEPVGVGDVVWQPGPVELFRFSAVTFNGHRIHYDLPYAMNEEGYPGLVIHGPFTATKLFGFARAGKAPSRYSYRAIAPMFASQPVRLTHAAGTGEVRAIRCDGTTAMIAKMEF